MEAQLNIDPLSLYIDPHLHRLCWNQTQNKIDYLLGYTYASKNISFKVFHDLHQSKQTFCIEKVDRDSIYTIGIPFKINKRKQIFEINVKFSVPLSSPWKIIRIQVVPRGIRFHLNSKFVGLAKHISPSCKVLLFSKTSSVGSEEIKLFDMDSHSMNNVFKKLPKGSSFKIFYSCHQFTFVDVSTSIISEHGTSFDKEQTFPLRPFVQIPFRRFILVLWQHPLKIPDSYIIVIRSEVKDKQCIRKFRLLRKTDKLSPGILKFNDIKCRNIVNDIDLGFYNGLELRNVHAVLNIDKLMKIHVRYKLSIFWKDSNSTIQENFVYFTPLPNENSANINPSFLYPNLSNYENLRNNFSIPYQNVASENLDYPIKSHNISALGYNDVLIIPVISENKHFSKSVIQSETLDNLVQRCGLINECSNGFYPFFYSLFTIETKTSISTEIIEIPKRENKINVNIEHLELFANNKSATFNVSWQVTNNFDFITPSFYLLLIKTTNTGKCILACYIKCRTCSTIYKTISEENNRKNISQISSNCDSIQIVENNYDALQTYIFFQTDKLPHSVHLEGFLYSVQLQSYSGPKRSKSNMVIDIPKENSWKYYLIIFSICFVLVFAAIFFIILKLLKNPRLRNEIKIKMDRRFSSIYEDDSNDGSNKYDDGEDK